MGQKWTTAHTLACRDVHGQSASVFHQVTTKEEGEVAAERFVLGNSELLVRRENVFYRRSGQQILLTTVTLS